MQSTDRPQQINRDLTLSPNSYLYLQSEAKQGSIIVHRGPCVVNQTGNDVPIKYNPKDGKFSPCSDLTAAVQQCPVVAEGDYVIIENPTENNSFPATQGGQSAQDLLRGRKVILPGPWSEALYPGQAATVIPGHRLRSNQYLIAMVYEADKAKEGWAEETVVETATDTPDTPDTSDTSESGEEQQGPAAPTTTRRPTAPTQTTAKGLPTPESFAVGTRIVIRGTQVSFFIPCTGVEVLTDEEGNYVREAVTLEQMEYCELIDESGKKQYPKGPDVVFPSPTQVFGQDSKKRRKFRPVELNTINGIHLKVTADFTGPDIEVDASKERDFKEGEELFVTGKTLAIYYPREELAVIEYGQGNKKHFSTAIPKGEGRYVIDRESGKIRIEKGYAMYLANPKSEIPVRRILDPVTCSRWYPENDEALEYNAELAEAMAQSPSGRSGLVSEGDVRKHRAKKLRGRTRGTPAAASYLAADSGSGLESLGAIADEFEPEDVGTEGAGKTIGRGTRYTEPRTLTLNTKYDGVPRIEVWPGYAVLVVGSESNERKVIEGPNVILLEYDEKLGYVTLSTNKPKSTDVLHITPYLCVQNNQVGDIIAFESADHVKGSVKISMRVTFEGESQDDKLKWFSTENYVKFLCDHVRSIIGGMAKRNSVADIKGNYIDLVRDAILGRKGSAAPSPSRPSGASSPDADRMENEGGGQQSTPLGEDRRTTRAGLFFPDNGMRVIEVEVLELDLADASISQMLNEAELEVVRSNIRIQQAEKDLEATTRLQTIAQKKLDAEHATDTKKLELQEQTIGEQLKVTLAQVAAELDKLEEDGKKQAAQDAIEDARQEATRARRKADDALTLETDTAQQKLATELITAETKAASDRMEAAKDGLSETLVALGRDDMAARLAEATNIERFITGDSLGSSLTNLLSFAPSLKDLFDRGEKVQADRTNRLRQTEESPTS
jgi:major vault protein